MAMFRRKNPPSTQRSSDVYDGLRAMALGITEAEVGGAPPEHPKVLGAVIDIPKAGGMASVAAMTDGTVSMYTSPGGGTIGAGAHEAVAAKSHALLTTLQHRIEMFPADDRVDLPPVDLVQITLITPTGRRRACVPADAFWGKEPSTVVDLIGAIHAVISAIRETHPPT
jgi:hypothetical protein